MIIIGGFILSLLYLIHSNREAVKSLRSQSPTPKLFWVLVISIVVAIVLVVSVAWIGVCLYMK